MFRIISYSELLEDLENCIFVDVRSQSEYFEETIPGAINIPVLLDEERVAVGTVYKNESVQKAKELGIQFISKRLPEIFKKFEEVYYGNKSKKIVLFCARGGMRSGSLYSLLNSLGLNVYKLKGGYKSYRQIMREELSNILKDINLVTLYGNTGVGKTDILKSLREKGYDVLDLEGAANHRGSLLGSVGLSMCHSQKMFESLVYEQLRVKKSNLIFTEGESRRIGRIVMANDIWEKITESKNIYITADLDFRAKRLVKEYTDFEDANTLINEALDKLKKYMSDERIERYKELILNGEYEEVSRELMIKYYDPMYMGASKKREFVEKIHIDSIDDALEKLIDIYEKIKLQEGLIETEYIHGSEFLDESFIEETYKDVKN